MAMDQYEQQAQQFLKSTGTTLKIGTPSYGQMAWDTTNRFRFIFPITFSRTVNGKRIRFTVKYGQSLTKGSMPPTKYDALACLTKSNPGSFENFCWEYGYNSDSRRAERIYKAVCKEWKNVDKLWHDEIEQFQEIT